MAEKEAKKLEEEAQRSASLAEGQRLSGEADRLRGDERPARRSILFPIFRN